jgi:hypothetical protein
VREVLHDHGHAALERLERIVAQHPDPLSEAVSEAVRRLVRLRDDLIERRRGGSLPPGEQHWLDCTNGILSLLVAAEYPVKSVHRKSLCQARDTLKQMLASE